MEYLIGGFYIILIIWTINFVFSKPKRRNDEFDEGILLSVKWTNGDFDEFKR